MNIVIDTNVILVSISTKSKYFSILKGFIAEKYTLCVSTDILLEYEEIIKQNMGSEFTEYFLQLIETAPNVKWINKFYKWELIKTDLDDNKFVDCAIACNAKYLVSDDSYFKILSKISFPKVEVMTAEDFKNYIENIL